MRKRKSLLRGGENIEWVFLMSCAQKRYIFPLLIPLPTKLFVLTSSKIKIAWITWLSYNWPIRGLILTIVKDLVIGPIVTFAIVRINVDANSMQPCGTGTSDLLSW